jgi:hypothetical protein
MKTFTITLIPLVLLMTVCKAQNDQKLVMEAFNNYKSAILEDKEQEAVKYVDSRTIKYYSSITDLVKNADSVLVNSLPVVDKLMVFTIRHRATKQEILSFDGKKLLVYAIQHGMVGKNSVANISIGEITINKQFAKGQVISGKEKSPYYFHFYKQEGQWKIDLTSLFHISTAAIKKIIADSGKSENDFLFMVLEGVSGTKPGPGVWKPTL